MKCNKALADFKSDNNNASKKNEKKNHIGGD